MFDLILQSAQQSQSADFIAELKDMTGVITPYKQQVREVKRSLSGLIASLGKSCSPSTAPRETIEVNTVDAFQGREKDIIIFNCVRSNENTHSLQAALGFLVDERRLNVAITRPKHFLMIIGDSRTLCRSKVWRALVEECMRGEAMEGPKRARYFRISDKSHYAHRNTLKRFLEHNSHKHSAPSSSKKRMGDGLPPEHLFDSKAIQTTKRQKT